MNDYRVCISMRLREVGELDDGYYTKSDITVEEAKEWAVKQVDRFQSGEGRPLDIVRKIVAFDPGKTTGVAVLREGPLMDEPVISTYQIVELEDVASIAHHSNMVIFEGFRQRHVHGLEYDTVERIGVIKLKASKWVEQQPSQKQFWTRAKIMELGLWKPGQPHAMDALRHLLYYLTFTEKRERYIHALEGT